MSTLKVDSITNGGSPVDFTGGLDVGNGSVIREYYAQTTEPMGAGPGAIWWNTDTSELKVYLSNKWYTITQVIP
jgi:hypothetical protein